MLFRSVVLFAIRIKRIPAAHLGVGVNVNGDEVLVVHGERCVGPAVSSLEPIVYKFFEAKS